MRASRHVDSTNYMFTRENNWREGFESPGEDEYGESYRYNLIFDEYSRDSNGRFERQRYPSDSSYYQRSWRVPDSDYDYRDSKRSLYQDGTQISDKRDDPRQASSFEYKRKRHQTSSPLKENTVKRQRTQNKEKSSSWCIPLSKIIMAKMDSKTGVPDIVFSRFYNCRQEAHWEKNRNLKLKVYRENVSNTDRVSIPIPNDSISGVSFFCGMNRFDKLLEVYDDKMKLKASIKHWVGVIEKRKKAHAKSLEELNRISNLENEIDEVGEDVIEEEVIKVIKIEELEMGNIHRKCDDQKNTIEL